MPEEYKIISWETWEKTYVPTHKEPLEDFPKNTPPEYMWTETETDGYWALASGNHLVNRTGRYWVTEVAHNYDVDVDIDGVEVDL